MDISSKKLPIILIIVLVGILLLQFMTNDNSKPLIDPETCELYIVDSQINTKTYLDEFNTKCLDFKNLNKWYFQSLIMINVWSYNMVGDKNEIDKLIDTMIESGDDLVENLKTVLPNSLSESMVMFHESNVENLRKIKEFLNG